MSKSKFYVVWLGRKPGIYTSWEECKNQVFKFEGAKYKSFKTIEEAEKAFSADQNKYNIAKQYDIKLIDTNEINIPYIKDSISADAACSGNPGPLVFDIIDRAIDWLHNNNWENQLLKWKTSAWGEIPADFGRKK